MRVMHILNNVTDRGNGIVNTAVDLALEQARDGLTVAMVSAGGGYVPLLEKGRVVHLTLDQSRNPIRLIGALARLARLIRDFRPEVVHTHMRTGLLLAWACKKISRFALVGHVHNVHDRESVVMGLADRVVAVSESVATSMARCGIPRRKIRVVLNRTLGNMRQVPIEEVVPAILERPAIVTVCGMSHRKGIAELIAAFAVTAQQHPTAHLYLVGDGPQRREFERRALQSGFSNRIHFAGFQLEPRAYMLGADVFVLASRRESFGLVLIEARQAGTAIVATDVDGIAEALDWGRAGMLLPPRNVHALAIALDELISQPERRSEWGAWAKTGISKFDVAVMAEEINRIYAELTELRIWSSISSAGRRKLSTHITASRSE
jgi:Glycosyltransferase